MGANQSRDIFEKIITPKDNKWLNTEEGWNWIISKNGIP
jgi:hypothetical protein